MEAESPDLESLQFPGGAGDRRKPVKPDESAVWQGGLAADSGK